jgi:hypothetical protein
MDGLSFYDKKQPLCQGLPQKVVAGQRQQFAEEDISHPSICEESRRRVRQLI